MIVNTSQCEKNCKYGSLTSKDPKKVKVFCECKNREYSYGQLIPCEDKEKK